MLSTASLSNTSSRADDFAPALVLDTNVVLDWLVFGNPACAGYAELVGSGRLRWLASPAMRDELAHVLARGVPSAWAPDPELIWQTWARLAVTVEPAASSGPVLRLRCTDPDDQKFVDLALGHGARWLLSRDRAVLRLASRSRPMGLEVLTPEAWLRTISAG